jgi:hypothetical protein
MLRSELRGTRLYALGLSVVCLTVVGAAAGASNTANVFEGSRASVALTENGSTKHVVISCANSEAVACARLAQLRQRPLERCLQIWGGPARAVIRLPHEPSIVVTRANSCEIGRWSKLQEQLR